ncbi:homeobox-leucine zipper protein HOX17-like [Andrographis paniculata]|uniref:homeobox-leucine zipper protein HOX17-like n=1 Tax=Andrographis paniculata TaxID=175694 RepID=UPI0021E803A6|nr:homeobox-leucine zipper protein HOX17-like [Andrographis paniculata]
MEDHHDHEVCLGLGLGLGISPKRDHHRPGKKNKHVLFLDLSIPLQTSSTDHNHNRSLKKIMAESRPKNVRGCTTKEDDDDDRGRVNNGFCRKKLRLTTDQTALLEDSFRHHTTLNTAQKQALAEKLHLKPRQVEVWFQNRRARTKLKQTEIDCEMLKKSCERLSDENRRLKKELLELRSSMENQPAIHTTSNSEGHKIWTPMADGKKKEAAAMAATTAAAVVEVVHGLALPKPNNDDKQPKLGFIGQAKIKGE